MTQDKLTITDIEQWIDNDEGLYNWWKSSRTSVVSRYTGNTTGSQPMNKREFIRQNRTELEACINRVLTGSKPAHYLAYGPR